MTTYAMVADQINSQLEHHRKWLVILLKAQAKDEAEYVANEGERERLGATIDSRAKSLAKRAKQFAYYEGLKAELERGGELEELYRKASPQAQLDDLDEASRATINAVINQFAADNAIEIDSTESCYEVKVSALTSYDVIFEHYDSRVTATRLFRNLKDAIRCLRFVREKLSGLKFSTGTIHAPHFAFYRRGAGDTSYFYGYEIDGEPDRYGRYERANIVEVRTALDELAEGDLSAHEAADALLVDKASKIYGRSSSEAKAVFVAMTLGRLESELKARTTA